MALLAATGACAESPISAAPHEAMPLLQADGGSPAVSPAATWTRLTLPLAPGMTVSHAAGVSDNGVVVGYMYGPSTTFQPFYWTAATGTQLLPLPPTATGGSAWGVSDDGRYVSGIVGFEGRSDPARWRISGATVSVAVLRRCGPRYPEPTAAMANSVNDAGVVAGAEEIVGVSWASPRVCPVPIVVITDTLRVGVAVNDVGSLLGRDPSPYLIFDCFAGRCFGRIRPLRGHIGVIVSDLNDANVVAGVSSDNFYKTPRPVTWSLATGTVPVGTGAALGFVGISNRGRVVWSDPTSPPPQGRTQLHAFQQSLGLTPYGVNTCGDIAGDEKQRAVLYKKVGSCD
jgi:hypothetical protein